MCSCAGYVIMYPWRGPCSSRSDFESLQIYTFLSFNMETNIVINRGSVKWS